MFRHLSNWIQESSLLVKIVYFMKINTQRKYEYTFSQTVFYLLVDVAYISVKKGTYTTKLIYEFFVY